MHCGCCDGDATLAPARIRRGILGQVRSRLALSLENYRARSLGCCDYKARLSRLSRGLNRCAQLKVATALIPRDSLQTSVRLLCPLGTAYTASNKSWSHLNSFQRTFRLSEVESLAGQGSEKRIRDLDH